MDTEARYPELRAAMAGRGLLQADLARMLKMSEPTITQYLNGTNEWPLELCVRLSLFFEIPIETILGYKRRDTTRILKLWAGRQNLTGEIIKDSVNVA